jgi:hypothetical protein
MYDVVENIIDGNEMCMNDMLETYLINRFRHNIK